MIAPSAPPASNQSRSRISGDELARVTWTYDPTGQLLSEHRSGANSYHTTFTYDPSGNRLTEENPVDGVTTSTYDAANRLLTADSLSGITTYSYDQAGKRSSLEAPSGDLTTYTWNGQNQLIQVELPDDEVITYVWAPVNKNAEERIATRDDGVEVEKLLWDNNNVIRETDDIGTVETDYTYQPQPYGDLVSDHRDTDSSFYRFDALGSTTGLTDEAGNTTDEFRYTAFGKDATTSGTSETPYRWVGQLGYRQDEATGLSNLRVRDYDPQTGQFTSLDPLSLEAGDSNFYRYLGNAPINAVDPSGLGYFDAGPVSSGSGWGSYTVYYVIEGWTSDRRERVGSRNLTTDQVERLIYVSGNSAPGRTYRVHYTQVQGLLATPGANALDTWTAEDWDNWFRGNDPSVSTPPVSMPTTPAVPASSLLKPGNEQCTLNKSPKYELIEPGLPFKLPKKDSGCELGYNNCEILLFDKASRLQHLAEMTETINQAYAVYVSLIPRLGTLLDLVNSWNGKDAISGEDLGKLDQAINVMTAAVPAIPGGAIADIIIGFMEQLLDLLRKSGECGDALLRKLEKS